MAPGEPQTPLDEILKRVYEDRPAKDTAAASPPPIQQPAQAAAKADGMPAGVKRLQLGRDASNRPVELPAGMLKRHIVILGASGSGKTVLGKCVLEEAALNGVPVVVIDPQGDLASLALGGSADDLLAHGTDPTRLNEYLSRLEFRTFTPASSKGIPLSASPLQLPPADLPEEEKIRSLDLVCSSLALLLGYDTEAEDGKAVKSLLYEVFEHAWRRGRPFRDFDSLSNFITELPPELQERTAAIVSEKDKSKLARNLRFMNVGMNQLLFSFGVPVSADIFLKPAAPGRVPVNIIYLNTLASDEHKQFFVTMIAREVYDWMLRHPSEEPQLVLYIDEVGPYLPPNPYMPPAKDILRMLFKQGRKYGVSCMMCTQNVADVDYKAMAQAATWALGRMMTVQDIEKVKQIIKAMNAANPDAIISALPGLKTGEFVLLCPDVFPQAVRFRSRWLYSKHVTLEEEKLRETMQLDVLSYFDRLRGVAPPEPQAAAPAARPPAAAQPQPSAFPGAPSQPAAQPAAAAPAQAAPAGTGGPVASPPPKTAEAPAPTGPAKARWEERKTPSALASYQGTMLVCRLKFPQVTAQALARKLTEAGLLDKVAVDKGELRYLPLWQLKLTIDPKKYMNSFTRMFARGKECTVEEKVYINGVNGKLLVIKDRFVFENVASEDPTRIGDLDEKAETDEYAVDPSMPDLVAPRVDAKTASAIGFKMFGVTADEVRLVVIPVWAFTTRIEGKWTAQVKYLDGVLGLEIPQDPFSGY
jgi:thymidylate kinase